MKNAWTIVVLLLIATACGPTAKLRRAEKLIKKAEEQGAKWSSDTVWVERVEFVPEIRVDSITIIRPGDSVVIFKDRLQVTVKRLRGDTVFIQGECAADTIKISVPHNVYRTIQARGWLRWWHLIIAFVFGVILGRLFKLVL